MAAKSRGAIPSSELLRSGSMIHPITCTARNLLLSRSPPLRDLWKVSGTLPHMRDGSFLATLPGMVNVIRPKMTAARHHPGTEMPRDGITCPWEGYTTPPPTPHTPRAVQAGHGRAGIRSHRHGASSLSPSPLFKAQLRTTKGWFSQQAEGPGVEKPHMQIKGSMRREACLLGTHAGTHVHTHARKAVPVTSFLGDSVQLVSHTSESPREQEEAGEKTVRQARGPLKSGCRH